MNSMTQSQLIANMPYFVLLFVGGSLLIIAAMLPLLMNWIRPNALYGFRIPKTLSNDRIWYSTNSYCARISIATSAITIVLALALRLANMPPLLYIWLCTISMIGGMIFAVIMTFLYAREL